MKVGLETETSTETTTMVGGVARHASKVADQAFHSPDKVVHTYY